MRPIKPFIYLSFGYAGMLAALLILDSIDGRFPFFKLLASSLVMAVIFHPPMAASFLFYLQTGVKDWWATALFSGFLAIPFTYLFYSTFYSAGKFGFTFVAIALFIASLLSIVILITGCISSLQRRKTRIFGFLSLACSLLFVPVLVLTIYNQLSANNDVKAIIISNSLGAVFLFGFIGLVLAVFYGPKSQEEQQNYEIQKKLHLQ